VSSLSEECVESISEGDDVDDDVDDEESLVVM
jgi:hypothetical protein